MQTADHAILQSLNRNFNDVFGKDDKSRLLVALEDLANVIERDKAGKRYIIPADQAWAIERAEQAIKKARGLK